MSTELIRLAHELAYSAARSDIECFCKRAARDGIRVPGYDVSKVPDEEDRESVDKAVRYLELRGLLLRDGDRVSVLDDGPVEQRASEAA